jgi:hypothetical protein
MQNLNGRRVKIARVHALLHVNGVGQIGPVLDANCGKVLGAVELYKVDGGVYLKSKTFEVYVPDGNIISVQFEPET